MINAAVEYARTPSLQSVWDEGIGKYLCQGDPRYPAIVVTHPSAIRTTRPPTAPAFKLVFLSAAGGTLLFVSLCVGTMVLIRGTPPPLTEEVIKGLFALANIGFGAVVGLLGGLYLRAET
jgi:hypothetical protein